MMQASFLLTEVNELLSIYLIYSNQTFKQPVVLHISVCEINMALRFTQKIGILFILNICLSSKSYLERLLKDKKAVQCA